MSESTIKETEITPDIAKNLNTEQLIEVAFGSLHAEPWMITVIAEIAKRLREKK